MLDINLVREHADVVKKDLEKRNQLDKIAWLEQIKKKDAEWVQIKFQVEELKKTKNALSKQISELKKNGQDAAHILKQVSEIPKRIQEKGDLQEVLKKEIDEKLRHLPNILHESVPQGADEEQNELVRKFGKKPTFDFPLKSHVDILKELRFADTERAAKIAGARFWFLTGELAELEMAIQKYGIDFMVGKGYTLVQPPFMMQRKAYEGVVDLSDFVDVIYKIEEEDLYLIATSEHPLTAMFMDEILDENCLPIKMAGVSTCFRKEAGSHGKDTKGIFRGHQFNKIEQIIICKPEESLKYHEELIKNAIAFFESLDLHFKQINMCTGDIGTIAAKKYDLECWMPVQKAFREVVSASNCTDYQARRLKMRYAHEGKKIIPHTLNATCVATSRLLAAILENFQNKDGTISVPKVLQKYMGGKKKIGNKPKK